MEYDATWTTTNWLSFYEEMCELRGIPVSKGSRKNRKKKLIEKFDEAGCIYNYEKYDFLCSLVKNKEEDMKNLVIIDDIKSNSSFGNWPTTSSCESFTLGVSPCPTPTKPQGFKKALTPIIKESKDMAYAAQVKIDVDAAAKSADADKVRHLKDRVHQTYWSKYGDLERTFKLYVDNTPKTFEELIAKIKEGKYTVDSKIQKKFEAKKADFEGDNFGDFWYHGPLYGLVWDGPQPDRKGFDAASEALAKARDRVIDDVEILSPVDGLAAFRAFEAWTPTGVAS